MKRRLRFIIAAFSISFVMMVGLSFYSMRQFDTLTDYSNQVDHTNNIITHLYRIQDIIKEIDIKERGYMLTRDSAYLEQVNRTLPQIHPLLNELRNLTQSSGGQQQTLILLGSAVAMRVASFHDNIAFIDSSGSDILSTYYFDGIKRKTESIKYIDDILQKENTLLKHRFTNKKYYQQIASDTIKYLLGVFFIVTIVLFILMIYELKQKMAFQTELQTKLQDLKRSHSELEQIAFAASHDLQEPLRKIRIFSNRLLWLKKDISDTESYDTLVRINNATGRMQELIEDMVNLTSLIKEDGIKEPSDLNIILKAVLTELDEKITRQHANIYREVLPVINGYPRQFHILLKSLLDNSLKFTRPDTPPVIAIRADISDGNEIPDQGKQRIHKKFHRITISDNGIGFDNKFISKMFQIFQRLHNNDSEFEGKGIGLAICQRIMVNHEGFIVAHGHTETGATFKLFFPLEE